MIESSNSKDEFINKLRNLSARDIHKIQTRTIGQSNNKLWFLYRKHLITGSIAHTVNNAYKKSNGSSRIRKLIAKDVHTKKNFPALQYGRDNEKNAIADFLTNYRTKHKNAKVVEQGLKIDCSSHWLAASVDGIIECSCCNEKLVIEVKCPYSLRNDSLKNNGHKLRYLDHNLDLKKTNPYYTQVQMYLGIYHLKNAKFVVWTPKDILILDISFDENFYNSVKNNIEKYYFDLHLEKLYS